MHERASLRPDNNYGFCNIPCYNLSETFVLECPEVLRHPLLLFVGNIDSKRLRDIWDFTELTIFNFRGGKILSNFVAY